MGRWLSAPSYWRRDLGHRLGPPGATGLFERGSGVKLDDLFHKLKRRSNPVFVRRIKDTQQLSQQVDALYGILKNLYGSERLVLRAGKLDALQLMRSDRLEERVLGLQRLVMEDPSIERIPSRNELQDIISDLEDRLAEFVARKSVEQRIEKKVAEKMQERQEEYVQELRKQVLQEGKGPDNPHTLKRYAELERLERRTLTQSAAEKLRPSSVGEVIGQEQAVKALFAKIVSPYPQHIILYGPPGVGKTTVARLALEAAKEMRRTPFGEEAKFVEVDGTTLRWDPREVTNPLLGSVHDPIYQGARRELAEGSVPEPKLGLVTEAHGGVLFIDEIGEMDSVLQNKLLKVLEDKRVHFDSAYYDPSDPNLPKYIKKLFEEGAPADFVLIGATTRSPEEINPALRSRCAEVYFHPLSGDNVARIVSNAAQRLGATLEPDVPELISQLTVEGRKATGILADAYGMAIQGQDGEQDSIVINRSMIEEVARVSRLSPHTPIRASETAEVGRVFGLGVSGFIGSVLEVEAVAFPAKQAGQGSIRFNDTAGSMAKDSVFNAGSVVRLLTGQSLSDYDIHVNVVGGGRIDGPSAGCAMVLAMISAIEGKPIRQDIAVTGEISIQGKLKPVGGIPEKIYGAMRANVQKVLVPADNRADVPSDLDGIDVVTIERVEEAFAHVFAEKEQPQPAAAMYRAMEHLRGAV